MISEKPAFVPVKASNVGEGEKVDAGALQKARKEITELTSVLKELEKERDWYFSKILEVEKICKDAPAELAQSAVIQQVFDVLYATDNSDAGGVAIAGGEQPSV
jgi:microtubule-associated protein, RP/EB family